MSHGQENGHSERKSSIVSFKNSFWLVIIVVGLFIAALNFIAAESGGEEGKGEATEKTEMKATTETSQATNESQADTTPQSSTVKDTANQGAK